jgi:glycosyltransferase involved in cell wall biosynthesis
MKIVVVGIRGFPGIQGGIENHCEKLYPHLAAQGCVITVFTRKPYINTAINTYKGIVLVPVNCPKNKFLEAIIHTFKCVIKAWKIKPDILHIHAIGPSLFALLARALGMKVVVTNHGPDYMREKWSLPAKIFLKICELIGTLFANELITIAKNIADDIKKNYGRNSTILPNGVNIPNLAETNNILREHDLQEEKYILAVGRFVPEKGFHDLIDAFNSEEFNDHKLVIAGSADHEDEYSRNLEKKAQSNNKIVLTGFITGISLQELYSHAKLFVLPSYYEGLPIVLLEAMSYGLSCIVSDIPANRNVELDEQRIFKPGDINSLAAKIKEFLYKPWKEEDRIKQINLISENYDWGKIADETLTVYKKIVF